MCIFKLAFWEKVWSQISHLNDLLESWTEAVCFVKLSFWEKLGSNLNSFFLFMNGFYVIFQNVFGQKTSSAITALKYSFAVSITKVTFLRGFLIHTYNLAFPPHFLYQCVFVGILWKLRSHLGHFWDFSFFSFTFFFSIIVFFSLFTSFFITRLLLQIWNFSHCALSQLQSPCSCTSFRRSSNLESSLYSFYYMNWSELTWAFNYLSEV